MRTTFVNHCLHCGKEWRQGCVISILCDTCRAAGHSEGLDCARCFPRRYVVETDAALKPPAAGEGEA